MAVASASATVDTSCVEVQEWIASLSLKPSSIRRYIATLRAVLNYASIADVEAIILHAPARWRLALMTLVETGMRVGELCNLEW
jgi:integrase